MRDLSKAQISTRWYATTGEEICRVYKGKRGAFYIAFAVTYPGAPGLTSWRDFRDMRQPQLTAAARMVGEYLGENKIGQDAAEKVLDMIYRELNRRLNKCAP